MKKCGGDQEAITCQVYHGEISMHIILYGLSWSHYINVMDTQIPGQEHLITDIIPLKYMEAIQ